MVKKCFVIDTNVLLHDPRSLFAFQDNEVVIPLVVLDELDKKKVGSHDETARHARMVIRSLDKMRSQGSIHNGVSTPAGGIVRVDLNHRDQNIPDLDPSRIDNRIIAVALGLKKEQPEREVILITKDINLRVKCDALCVVADDYNADSVADDANSIYCGTKEIVVTSEDIERLHQDGVLNAKEYGEFYENQYVFMNSNTKEKHTSLARYSKDKLVVVIPPNDIWGISSRNKEQAFALDALFNPEIKLVTMTGIAGSGKTLVAAAAGISQVLGSSEYKKLIMTRPVQPMGRDIGFLPGPQPLDAKILTPSGWTTMGALKVGDRVIAKDGSPTKILNIYPKGKKKVYKVTTTDGSTECCIDHLWSTRTFEDKECGENGTIKSTYEILNTLKTKKEKINHYLPRNGPVLFDESELLIPPYTLGVILGGGCIGDSISITSTNKELLNRVSKEIEVFGCCFERNSNTIMCIISGNPIKEKLYRLGLSDKNVSNKFVPDVYKYNSSVKDRLDILRGLMDSDGAIEDNGESSYSTISLELANDVVDIVNSLGGRAIIRTTDEKRAMRCDINLPSHMNPFHIQDKAQHYKCEYIHNIGIQSIDFVGEKEVQCILIDNPEHLYITDDFIVTHNTIDEKMAPWMAPLQDNLELLFSEKGKGYLEMQQDSGMIEVEALTYIRGRSIPRSYIIIDEAQQLTSHEIKTIITRVGDGSKVVLTGDILQIDNPFIDSVDNGLSCVVEKFKHHSIAAHITLQKGERSELATLAAETL